MKKITYIGMLAGALLVSSLTSCTKDFLEEPVRGALSPELVANRAGVEKLLIGSYGVLDGVVGAGEPWESSPDNWIYGSVAGGDAHKGSDGGDQPAIDPIAKFIADGSNGFFNNRWRTLYDGVNTANSVLALMARTEGIPEADQKNLAGQARFLRGHYYFELKKLFNMVPWIDETMTDFNQPNDKDIWPMIEADFQFAYENLPPAQSDVGRANKWAAGAYLAKTYMYQKKFNEAKAIYDVVIAQGQTSNGLKYGLVERFKDNFDAATENNKESVFAVQMVAGDGTNSIANSNNGWMLNYPYGDSPFRCCGFYQPTQELVNSYRTTAAGLPVIDGYNQQPVKNDMGVAAAAAFEPDAGRLDPRLDWTVGRRGLPYHDWGYHPGASWIRLQSYGGPFAPKKNIYWQSTQDQHSDQSSWAPGNAINVLIIRFADVLLMAAEAEAQVGSLAKAQEYVNLVRARAASQESWLHDYVDPSDPLAGFSNAPAANYVISPYPAGHFGGLGKEAALRAIYFERKLELAMEGHRFFDLVRWGIAEQTLNAYFQYESTITTDIRGGRFVSGKNEYYPIPNFQIDLSVVDGTPMLQQNPNYN